MKTIKDPRGIVYLAREYDALSQPDWLGSRGEDSWWASEDQGPAWLNHPGDIPTGTLRAILKQLGIQRENLDSL